MCDVFRSHYTVLCTYHIFFIFQYIDYPLISRLLDCWCSFHFCRKVSFSGDTWHNNKAPRARSLTEKAIPRCNSSTYYYCTYIPRVSTRTSACMYDACSWSAKRTNHVRFMNWPRQGKGPPPFRFSRCGPLPDYPTTYIKHIFFLWWSVVMFTSSVHCFFFFSKGTTSMGLLFVSSRQRKKGRWNPTLFEWGCLWQSRSPESPKTWY